MESKDMKRFSTMLYGMAEEYGGKISKHGVTLKYNALKKYDIYQIMKAATWIIRNREKTYPAIPTVQEFEKAIGELAGDLGKKAIAALEADKVLKNLKYFGRECPTQFKNKTTQYLMTHRWNFHKLGLMDEKDLKWWRKDFIESFIDLDSDNAHKLLPDQQNVSKKLDSTKTYSSVPIKIKRL